MARAYCAPEVVFMVFATLAFGGGMPVSAACRPGSARGSLQQACRLPVEITATIV